ncbi:hypothetical protein BD779DRAFT_1433850, partial [Infundibulicybe gibba]
MVNAFILHVLGVDAEHTGLYGDTSGYYGTVEQQGRLTLHLHMLLWIRGGLTPEEIRKRIVDPESDFLSKIVEYLESCHSGEFATGTQEDVLSNVEASAKDVNYMDPTETLPEPPAAPCKRECEACDACTNASSWWSRFKRTVDDIVSRSNIHKCGTNKNKDGSQNKARAYKGCLDNMWGKCKARFPRPTFAHSEVDPVTGALNLKKNEPWINTFTPVVSYLFRCNTDVTSLRSGTAIKAVLMYVSDYITKVSLKTHVVFDSIRAMFQK